MHPARQPGADPLCRSMEPAPRAIVTSQKATTTRAIILWAFARRAAFRAPNSAAATGLKSQQAEHRAKTSRMPTGAVQSAAHACSHKRVYCKRGEAAARCARARARAAAASSTAELIPASASLPHRLRSRAAQAATSQKSAPSAGSMECLTSSHTKAAWQASRAQPAATYVVAVLWLTSGVAACFKLYSICR